MNFTSRLASVCILLLLSASAALAQVWPPAPSAAPEPAPSWGVTAETAVTVGSFEMVPYGDGVVINTHPGSPNRYIASATGFPLAVLPVELPRGAIITRFEFDGCNEGLAQVDVVYLVNFANGSRTGVSQIFPPPDGCGTYSSDPISHTVGIGSYGVIWSQPVPSPMSNLSMVRVYYKLQVSPAPLTATFGDVPVGNPLHQFVEALVAAGITAGCGEGNYCPGAEVTRGQMAVFLAKALGLHWAP